MKNKMKQGEICKKKVLFKKVLLSEVVYRFVDKFICIVHALVWYCAVNIMKLAQG